MLTRFRFKASRNAAIDPAEDRRIEGGSLTVGRAPGSDLKLVRFGLRYHHAKLRISEEGVTVEAEVGAALGPEAQPISTATLQNPGDEVRVGPYLLSLQPPDANEPNEQIILVVFEQESPFDQGARVAQIVERFSVTLPNVRLWAFSLSVVVFILCFVVPLLSLPSVQSTPWMSRHGHEAADQAAKTFSARVSGNWSVGSFSNGHATFSANCAACHEGDFVRVRQGACLECHQAIGQHVNPKPDGNLHPQGIPAVDIHLQSCPACHQEHRGPTLISTDDTLNCVSCHSDLHTTAPDTKLQNVTDFGQNHPRFSPALVQDAKKRVMARFVTGDPKATDNSNITFDHAKHLKKWFHDPKQPWDGAAKAAETGSDCAACHVPQANGQFFQEVKFEQSCVSCHKLQFEPKHPEWQLPHGFSDEIVSRVTGYYARAAMDGETFTAPSDDLFKIPDKLTPPPANSDPVSAQVEATMVVSIAGSACGECHKVAAPVPPTAPTEWRVLPVYDPDHYLTKARFNHAKHTTMRCQDCHAAEASDEGAMALLPDIETCRTCHSSQAAARLRVDSRCTDCHIFHDPALPVQTKPGSIFPQAAAATAAIGSEELK